MYNAENSTPRKGFGQHPTHSCVHCNKQYTQPKGRNIMMVCDCGELIKTEDNTLKELERE